MKIAVRYASRGGNTRAVADVIAKQAGVEAKRVSQPLPLNEEVDVLFLGGGVWFMDVTKDMKAFIDSLDKSKVKQVVAFSTSSDLDAATKKISKLVAAKGIKVNSNQLTLKMLLQGFTLFAPAGGDLKPAQIEKVQKFADKVLTEVGASPAAAEN